MKSVVAIIFLWTIAGACAPKKEVKEFADTTTVVAAPKDEAIVIGEQSETDTLKGSMQAKAIGKIGNTTITIRYYSPAVRGRIIWGGLVPYDKVWVTGAHMATSIEFDQPVTIAGKPVPAGKYAFFTIPRKDKWTIILNSNWKQHLADSYDEKLDVLRVTVEPEHETTNQERLRYVIEAEGDVAEIVVYWEKVEVSLEIGASN